MKKFALGTTIIVLYSSFIMAIHDKDFRQNYARIAIASMHPLTAIVNCSKKREKGKNNHNHPQR
jgi:hypothetical protein